MIRPEPPRKRAREHRPKEVCGCLAQPSKTGVRETLSAIGFSKRLLRGGRAHLNSGEITANTAPEAQAQILPLAQPNSKLVLDMTKVPFMSSAGLRMLLVIYRTITDKGGKVVLVGLAEELKNTMSITGFLGFFSHFDTIDAGIAAVQGVRGP